MYPEQPTILPNPYAPTNRRRRLVPALIAMGLIVISGGIWVRLHAAGPKGTVQIQYNPSTVNGLSIQLGDERFDNAKVNPSYQLAPGTYALKITAPGYKTFTVSVPVTKDKITLVNAQLESSVDTTITSPTQISTPNGVSVTKVISAKYYLNKSWALLTVDTNIDPGSVLVVQYDYTASKWQTKAGPALALYDQDMVGLPGQIQQDLEQGDYIIQE